MLCELFWMYVTITSNATDVDVDVLPVFLPVLLPFANAGATIWPPFPLNVYTYVPLAYMITNPGLPLTNLQTCT